jgi:hypothetical protein
MTDAPDCISAKVTIVALDSQQERKPVVSSRWFETSTHAASAIVADQHLREIVRLRQTIQAKDIALGAYKAEIQRLEARLRNHPPGR